MKLFLKNIGKIGEASVEINGITVIAGENNTGKSTVGRTLYAIFNSFYNIKNQIKYERIQSVENLIGLLYRNTFISSAYVVDINEISRNIVTNIEHYKNKEVELKKDIINAFLQYDENLKKDSDDSTVEDMILRIVEVLNVSDTEIFKSVIRKKMGAEFNGQISNIFLEEDGKIELQIKDECSKIIISNDNIIDIQNSFELRTEAIYLDDPFVLDESRYPLFHNISESYDHRSHLRKKLLFKDTDSNLVDEIITSNKFDSIYSKISSVCGGEVVKYKRSGFGYKREGTDKVLDVRNLSTGLKTFVILKMLLLNGVLEYNGTIILDEPEIHLHPEWQLLFAELIVLIQKEFGMHILLNTHSPYFLNAIEVYSKKYETSDKCKYYLATVKDGISHIEDVSGNIEAIYAKLARPLQDLENERYRYD